MVHVPGGTGFLLDIATSGMGKPVILCGGRRASVLAYMEKQTCKKHFGRSLSEAIEFVSATASGVGHSRLDTHNRIRHPGFVDDVCLVQYEGG